MLKIKSNKDEEFDKIIRTNLRKFNKSKCQWMKDNLPDIPEDDYYNFAVYDDGKLVGGATGIIQFDWYFLEELWIDEKYRNNHVGTMLIEKIEELAKNKNLTGIRMETWNFQARGFYEKKGYEVYAQFEDCPPGTIEYFLKKRLK